MTKNSGFGKSSTARNMVKTRSKMRVQPKAAPKPQRAKTGVAAAPGDRVRSK